MTNLLERCKAAGYCEPFSREKNIEIYIRLVKGDKLAREEMIQGNMALVISKVDNHLRQFPEMAFYRDDITSAALVGLIKAVDAMQKKGFKKDANPTGYIAATIENHITECIDENTTIVVPHRTQKRARDEGKPIERPKFVSAKDSEKHFATLLDADENAAFDLEEEIKACCQDESDLKIVSMRKEGYTDSEIAETIGMSGQQAISRRRAKIFERLKVRCPEYA